MGVVDGISADEFPKQGRYLGRPVSVVFNYDTSREFAGLVVRDDMTEPDEMIIALADGRFVRAVECQYSLTGGVIAPQLRALLPLVNWLHSRTIARGG